jgi:hypothetical protein
LLIGDQFDDDARCHCDEQLAFARKQPFIEPLVNAAESNPIEQLRLFVHAAILRSPPQFDN